MYNPTPRDLNSVELPGDLAELVEDLAEFNHDTWARNRMNDGWTFGPTRNDELKQHPCLVPYSELPENEKKYDRDTSVGAIKLIIALGYTPVKNTCCC